MIFAHHTYPGEGVDNLLGLGAHGELRTDVLQRAGGVDSPGALSLAASLLGDLGGNLLLRGVLGHSD